MAKNIKWSLNEWEKLSSTVHGMRIKDPNLSLVKAANNAQQQLPEDRRRTLSTIQHIKPIVNWLSYRAKQGEQAIENESQLRSRIAYLEQLIEQQEDENPLDRMPLEEIAAYCSSKFTKLLQQAAAINKPEPAVARESTTTTSHKRQVPIGICGLLPSQFNTLDEACEHRLVFIDKKQGAPMPKKLKGCIVVTAFISHARQNELRSKHVLIRSASAGTEYLLDKIKEITNGD